MLDDLMADLIDLETLTDMALNFDSKNELYATVRLVGREISRLVKEIEKKAS